jgi:DNA modification methylase
MSNPVRARTRRRIVDLQNTSSLQSAAPSLPNDPNDGLALQVEYRPLSKLTPPPRRLRKANKRQDAAIRAIIANFGNLDPILIAPGGRIICGYARYRAAVDLGLAEVPTITVSHLSEEQLRLYAIAEEKLGELGEWDQDALRLEFTELSELDLSLDLNLELTGFTMSEIDDVLVEKDVPGDTLPGFPSHAPVCVPGDTFQLGEHRLYCGDALQEQSYITLMGDERAQIVFCDPPYNQPMRNISGRNREEFAMASGEMNGEEFTSFLRTSFMLMARFSEDGAIHYQCMDWAHAREMLDAGEAVYSRLRNQVVWNKGTGGQGCFYRSQHEFIYVWQVGEGPPINNFGLGETGRYRTNVWDYQGNNSFHSSRDDELASHPTVKPVALIADALRDCSHRGGIVLDAFGGSGSTLIAAEHTGRRARLIEIDPGYCDTTIERWQAKTGQEAVHLESGKTWSEIAVERGVDLCVPGDSDREEMSNG